MTTRLCPRMLGHGMDERSKTERTPYEIPINRTLLIAPKWNLHTWRRWSVISTLIFYLCELQLFEQKRKQLPMSWILMRRLPNICFSLDNRSFLVDFGRTKVQRWVAPRTLDRSCIWRVAWAEELIWVFSYEISALISSRWACDWSILSGVIAWTWRFNRRKVVSPRTQPQSLPPLSSLAGPQTTWTAKEVNERSQRKRRKLAKPKGEKLRNRKNMIERTRPDTLQYP